MRRSILGMAISLLACSGPAPADGGVDAPADSAIPVAPSQPAPEPYVALVDPFLGTGGVGFNDIGSAFPGPQRPFGMVRPGPDTAGEGGSVAFLHCSGFHYDDPYVTGFSHARMHGTGIADYASVGLMPIGAMEPAFTTMQGHRTRWTEREASPGYLAITLERGGVRAELTSTDRVALHRYRFEAGAPIGMLLDVAHTTADPVTITDTAVAIDASAREVSGFTHFSGGYSGRFGGMPVFFVARFDRPFATHGVWEGDALREGEASAAGATAGAWVTFDPAEGDTLVVEVAISFVDVAGARANLEAETTGFDFDRVRIESEAIWEEWLSRVRIEGRSQADFERFYTALYHSLLMPTLAMDADGRYPGLDGAIHTADGYRYYTDFSLWDTFRTLHPLITLLYPEVALDMARSLVAMARDGGAVPRWPLGIGYTGGMVGDPGAIVLADTWQKGIRDFDLRTAYDALHRSAYGRASDRFEGRGGAEIYDRLGYSPIEAGGGSASKTLEFAYADWALARLAEALDETEHASDLDERAGSWRHSWDPARGFFVGRHEDGSFASSFREDRWEDYYTEGNAWQYLWYVPHDLEGLAETMGGRDVLLGRLRQLFEESERERRTLLPPKWYWHGNEPDLHAAFIFSALGEPEESARWSRWVARTMYGDGPRGLAGNDDGGTLSAWLVFASLGFFPIAGRDDYLLGSPLLTRAELAIGGGTFTIEAPEASDRAPYIREARLDGEALSEPRFLHSSIVPGGRLELDMRAAP